MNITKFRKKPVVIEAVRWLGNNLREVINFTGLHPSANKWSWEEYEQVVKKEGLKIFTLEGPLIATEGDWIIRGLRGEYYPCKCDIFEATYDPVDATSELDRLTAELKEKEGECERQVDRIIEQEEAIKRLQEALSEEEFQRKRAKSLAASRLADQEAIERHTRKQIYRELYEIRYEPDKLLCKIERECSPYIRQKYGVE